MSIPVPSPLQAGITADFLRRRAPELARDIVAQLDGAANLAKSYGLDEHQWAVLRQSPAFRDMLVIAHEDLSGPAGIAERTRRKAAMAIEKFGVVDMATILGDEKVSAQARIAAFSELKDVAGLGKQQTAMTAPGTSGPLISIHYHAAGQEKLVEFAPAIEHEA